MGLWIILPQQPNESIYCSSVLQLQGVPWFKGARNMAATYGVVSGNFSVQLLRIRDFFFI